jgi:hypothetical protein
MFREVASPPSRLPRFWFWTFIFSIQALFIFLLYRWVLFEIAGFGMILTVLLGFKARPRESSSSRHITTHSTRIYTCTTLDMSTFALRHPLLPCRILCVKKASKPFSSTASTPLPCCSPIGGQIRGENGERRISDLYVGHPPDFYGYFEEGGWI